MSLSSGELTMVGMAVVATTAMSGAVVALWRESRARYDSLEKRSESYLAVATEQLKTYALLQEQLRGLHGTVTEAVRERALQVASLEQRLLSEWAASREDHKDQLMLLSAIQKQLNGETE